MHIEPILACRCGLPVETRRLIEEGAGFDTAQWAIRLCRPEFGLCCMRRLVVHKLHVF